ncbi:MAG: adenylyl-sulfate kinase [Lentisphaeria bacterium]
MRMNKTQNLTGHDSKIQIREREQRLGQRGVTVWFTGLSASGKSTIAGALERRLFDEGHLVYWLDGDNVRTGINADLGFSAEDRTENIRRIAEAARLFNDAGLLVVAAFISPSLSDRMDACKVIGDDRFYEVYLDAPLEVCEERDPKGLYRKAREGLITEFTGVSAPYEVPMAPALTLNTATKSINECVEALMSLLADAGALTS